MSLAVIFSDLHIHNYKRFNEGNQRLNNCLSVLDYVFKFARKNDITYILFSGDLYDNQRMLPTEVVNATVKRFHQLFEEYPEIVFYAISGNHDHASKNTLENPAISALEHLADIFPQFVLLDNMTSLSKAATIHGIPYYEYPEHFSQKLDEAVTRIDPNYKNILLMHQTPSDMGNPNIPVDVDINDPRLKLFDMVFNGHIHPRAILSEKFINVGSPLHRDLGDVGQTKGFLIIDLEFPETHKFVSLKGKFPEFIRIKANANISEDIAGNYIVQDPEQTTLTPLEVEKVEEFRADLSPEQLIENYWNEVDGQDKELLATGIKLVRSL